LGIPAKPDYLARDHALAHAEARPARLHQAFAIFRGAGVAACECPASAR
jgi:hypothetical protein